MGASVPKAVDQFEFLNWLIKAPFRGFKKSIYKSSFRIRQMFRDAEP